MALAVALLSAAMLAYEILLVRVFAIEHFHHLASLAIGVAMLGHGAAGVLLARGGPPAASARTWFGRACALASLALVASPILVRRLELDPTRLVWDVAEWPRLGALVIVAAIPFLLGGLAVLLALMAESHRPGRIYGASFAGSGLGAVLALAALWAFLPARALEVPAVLAALGAACAVGSERGAGPVGSARGWNIAWAGIAAPVAIWALALPNLGMHMSPYKALPQVEAYPRAHRLAEYPSPLGWLVAVGAPAFRSAPGLSLEYHGPFPEQIGLFVDGETAGAVTSRSGAAAEDYLDWLPTALPYALGGRNSVLLIDPGGDAEVRSARLHGAERVVAVELHPQLIRLARAGDPDAEWVAGSTRRYLARTPERFDLIALSPGGTLGGSAAGVHGMQEDFGHTVDAYRDYLRHLNSGGVLAVTQWLATPPRASVRTILTVAQAMREVGPAALGPALVVSHSWATATVLVKPSGFSPADMVGLRRWADARGFDLDWWPGAENPPPLVNELEAPVPYRAARAASTGRREAAAFASRYPFDVAPVTDARPYPHHYMRPGSLPAFLRARGAAVPFTEWGFVTLVATTVISGLIAAFAMLVPAFAGRGPGGRSERTGLSLGRTEMLPILGFFGLIGLAYMAAEIALLPPLGLLLGHPVYAVSLTLAALLAFSGWGSLWSDRTPPGGAWRRIAVLSAVLVVWALALLPVVHAAAPAVMPARAAVALLALGVPGFLMGTAFPVGWRAWVCDDRRIAAWAWAANGFAAVVAAPLATLLSLEVGWPATLGAAALAYAMAGAVALATDRARA